jgi:hypothetical protein
MALGSGSPIRRRGVIERHREDVRSGVHVRERRRDTCERKRDIVEVDKRCNGVIVVVVKQGRIDLDEAARNGLVLIKVKSWNQFLTVSSAAHLAASFQGLCSACRPALSLHSAKFTSALPVQLQPS